MKDLLIISDIDLNGICISTKESLKIDINENSRIQTLLWIHEECTPVAYRIYHKKDTKRRNKNFVELLDEAKERNLDIQLVCLETHYATLDNLKHIKRLGWQFLGQFKASRRIKLDPKQSFFKLNEIEISKQGTIVYLNSYGYIKVFKNTSDLVHSYFATSLLNEDLKQAFKILTRS